MTDDNSKQYLTPAEVAVLLRVAPVTVRAWAHKGLLQAQLTPGGHRRFLHADVERFAAERGLTLGSGTGGGKPRVLIVDDNTLLVGYLAELLGMQGAATESAHDGFDAGLKVLRFRPDVVLLDLMMPGIDGFAVCRQIKSEPATRAIRVIAMTGYHTPEHVAGIRAAGAECCLAKPLDDQRLLDLIGLAPLEPLSTTPA